MVESRNGAVEQGLLLVDQASGALTGGSCPRRPCCATARCRHRTHHGYRPVVRGTEAPLVVAEMRHTMTRAQRGGGGGCQMVGALVPKPRPFVPKEYSLQERSSVGERPQVGAC